MAVPLVWGATPAEVARRYPADDLIAPPAAVLTRAVDVRAPAALLYRWLCQIALAPYSYDLIDNFGRRSPPELVPGVDNLQVGQRLMIFRLTEVEPGHRYSALMLDGPARVFGRSAITYAAEPVGAQAARLVCRLVVAASGPIARLRAHPLAWGDLLMMRKQLLTLREYAERDARAAASPYSA